MRSSTGQRILDETPQEIKDKVRKVTDREVQLLRLGFYLNEHQDCYTLYKYDNIWYVDFNKITDYDDSKWNILIDDLIYDIQQSKIYFVGDLKDSEGYTFAKKEVRHKLLDELNKYRSLLQHETKVKMDRREINTEKVKELNFKIEAVKQIIKKI